MTTHILLLRHAEKPDERTGIYGVTPDGHNDSYALSVTGWQRAGALAPLFTHGHLPVPDRIYASAFREGGGHSRRPEQTVLPLAQRLGLRVDLTWALHQERAFGAALSEHKGTIVVCWQHQGLADLVRAIARPQRSAALPPGWRWPPERYDVIWSLQRDVPGGRWRFVELCQRLLAGDSDQPFFPGASDVGV